eukprot:scaffold14931_cov44-Prasinocladus_malaysianus.AAC.2
MTTVSRVLNTIADGMDDRPFMVLYKNLLQERLAQPLAAWVNRPSSGCSSTTAGLSGSPSRPDARLLARSAAWAALGGSKDREDRRSLRRLPAVAPEMPDWLPMIQSAGTFSMTRGRRAGKAISYSTPSCLLKTQGRIRFIPEFSSTDLAMCRAFVLLVRVLVSVVANTAPDDGGWHYGTVLVLEHSFPPGRGAQQLIGERICYSYEYEYPFLYSYMVLGHNRHHTPIRVPQRVRRE